MVACLVRELGERARGLGLEQIAGVDALQALSDPAGRLPFGADDAIFTHAARRLNMPWLGLWFASEAVSEGAFGALGYIARHAPDLSTALDRVVRYGRLFSSGEPTKVSRGPHSFRIVEGAEGASEWSPIMGDAVLASWLTLIRRFTRTDVLLLAAEFAYPRPADVSRHRAHFGDVLRFGTHAFAVEFPNAALDLPMQGVDPVLAATLERQAQDLLGQDASESALLRRVQALMHAGQTDLEGVAQAMAMHPRTLQRRLGEHGTSWREVRDRFRNGVAQRGLKTPGVSLKKVASAAGFASVASFRRAYKRWTGYAP